MTVSDDRLGQLIPDDEEEEDLMASELLNVLKIGPHSAAKFHESLVAERTAAGEPALEPVTCGVPVTRCNALQRSVTLCYAM